MVDSANISFRSSMPGNELLRYHCFHNDARSFAVIPTAEKRGVADVYRGYPEWAHLDKYSWFKRQSGNPGLAKLMEMWRESLKEPYFGVTCDGQLREDLYTLQDEGAPVKEATEAAKSLLALLDGKQRDAIQHDLESDVWRCWANPEFYANQYGLRLDEANEDTQQAALALLKASMSPAGFEKAQGCMRTNEFLGQLVGGEKIMNEFSYNLNIFGTPSETDPWGFSLYGHHLCIAIAFVGPQMVISPTFFGAEPDVIDEGKHKGLTLFRGEELDGLRLMQSLRPELQKRAQLYPDMHGERLPEARFNPFDERHVAGAFRDNRVIPFEGCPVSGFSAEQKKAVLQCIRNFIEYLPDKPLEAKMQQVEKYLDETWFVWYGGFRDQDPYYYRLHSPVIIVEFDFHAGIFLTNDKPAKFHIHTVVRTPNGNDYAKQLIKQWRARRRSEP